MNKYRAILRSYLSARLDGSRLYGSSEWIVVETASGTRVEFTKEQVDAVVALLGIMNGIDTHPLDRLINIIDRADKAIKNLQHAFADLNNLVQEVNHGD